MDNEPSLNTNQQINFSLEYLQGFYIFLKDFCFQISSSFTETESKKLETLVISGLKSSFGNVKELQIMAYLTLFGPKCTCDKMAQQLRFAVVDYKNQSIKSTFSQQSLLILELETFLSSISYINT